MNGTVPLHTNQPVFRHALAAVLLLLLLLCRIVAVTVTSS